MLQRITCTRAAEISMPTDWSQWSHRRRRRWRLSRSWPRSPSRLSEKRQFHTRFFPVMRLTRRRFALGVEDCMRCEPGWECQLSYHRSISTQRIEMKRCRGVHVEYSPVICVEPSRVCPVLRRRTRALGALARARAWVEMQQRQSAYIPPSQSQLN